MDLLTRFRADPLPFAALLGVELVSVEPDRVVATMLVRPDLCTAGATVHGGALMAFADTLGAIATVANLPDGAKTTTIDSKTNFIGGAAVGVILTGESLPVHRGRRTQVWQTRVTDPSGRLVAQIVQTQLVL